LIPVNAVEELGNRIAKDKKYRMTANTITIRRFGPSGSLKAQNTNLESKTDVINRINNDTFLDLKYIL